MALACVPQTQMRPSMSCHPVPNQNRQTDAASKNEPVIPVQTKILLSNGKVLLTMACRNHSAVVALKRLKNCSFALI